MNENALIGLAVVLAIAGFYATQQVTGSTGAAIAVGLFVGVVLPAGINELSE